MRALFLGVSVLALTATAVQAQQPVRPASPPSAQGQPARPATPAPTMSSQQEMAKFLVFFDWDKAALTAEARRVISSAAEEFRKSGAARIVAAGHTDTSGSAQYNMRLSIRRADAVKAELIRLGVPGDSIVTVGKGQTDPLVPTGDGIREPQNRRVEIEFPKAPRVAAAPPPPPPPAPAKAAPPPPPPPPLKWAAGLGGFYGYSIKETDRNDDLSAHLAGISGEVNYYPVPMLGISLEQAGYNTVGTSASDGYGGRSVIGLELTGDFGSVHPYIGANFGGVYGSGVQDGMLAGPELGMKVDLSRNWFMYAKGAYDVLFMRNDWDDGLVTGGLGAGYRF